MKKLVFLVVSGVLASAALAEAQQPRNASPQPSATLSLRRETRSRSEKSNADLAAESAASLGQMTPEVWFYQQELRRYEDPHAAVRRKAEFRAWQRQRRVAAMQWYGFSNSRPQANPIPWQSGVYGAGWVANNYRHPLQWSGAGRTAVIHGSTR